MPRLSAIQSQARGDLRAIAATGLLPSQMARKLMTSLEKAIGWDGYRLFGVDSQTLLINRLLAASDNDAWARREWLQDVYLSNESLPYIELPTVLRIGLQSVAYQERQEISWGYPRDLLSTVSGEHHRRYFHESASPVGGVLLAGFRHDHRWIAALQAYRRDPDRPFRQGDVDFLKRSGSVIGPALGRAFTREQALKAPTAPALSSPSAAGIVMVSPGGEIAFSTPAGESWLELLSVAEGGGSSMLPTALWSAMMGLGRGDLLVAGNTVKAMTPVGAVTIDASASDRDGGVALVISPVRPAPPPRVPDHWPLTDQQREIVVLLARGMTNRRIAESLFVSEHTVEWHIRQIFDRLDVRSRTQLIARYFREEAIGNYQDISELDGDV